MVGLAALTAWLARLGLPALSLPYCGTALLLLHVLRLRERAGRGLVLTPVQRYSPERNLYAYATDQVRLAHAGMVPLTLPFLGTWRCTQGYPPRRPHPPRRLGPGPGLRHHTDADGRTYQGAGLSLSDFYAYNKPVLAPADGVVVEVIQHIDDNPIGEVNLVQNWGNTVVVRHAPGLYTQLSHLRAHSVPVQVGEQVRRGDVLGTCGNSGRSPEPHLHFQVQATPYVGSRTLAYPLAYFMAAEAPEAPAASPAERRFSPRVAQPFRGPLAAAAEASAPALVLGAAHLAAPRLRHFAVPVAGETVSLPAFHQGLSQALRLPPGYVLEVRDANEPDTPARHWEVSTDAYNLRYLRCQHSGAMVYYRR